MSDLVLLVTDVFHPVHHLTVFLFLDSDVRHGRGGCSAVPVLLAGREPNHVTGSDFFNRPSPALRATAACRDDQSLAQRMRVPGGPRSRFKSYAGALNKCRIRRLKKRVDAYCAGEPVRWSLAGSLRAGPLDFH